MPHEFQQNLPHLLVVGKDKAYCKFLARTMPGDNSALEVNSNDDIDDFLTLTNIR
jgi:hypothetical protein